MSSVAPTNLTEIEVASSQPTDEGGVPTSPKKDLNPNAAAFDSLNYLTISDEGSPNDVQVMTNTNDREEHSPTETQNNFTLSGEKAQYSPAMVNGLAPFSSPVNPDMPPVGMSAEHSPDSLPLEELKPLLRRQLEFYFSRQNLAVDSYLLSQMDNDQYVPIWTVANFNQVKKLTSNIELVKEVLRESPNLQVDESGEKVRPNVNRCIVVLREIPESTPIEEVRELFSGEGCPKWTSCEFAFNNYWNIQFETEGDAQKAYRYLREEVKTFKGKAIMARIKAKPIHQSNPKNGLRMPQQGAVQSQSPQQMVDTQAAYSQRHFQFPPVQPIYTGQQPFPYPYPPPVLHQTWPPGQAMFPDTAMGPQGYPNGFPHVPPLKPVGPGNAGRHTFPGNRPRFPNKAVHHRDQQSERGERDGISRNRPQSTNGSINQNQTRNAQGTFRQRESPRDGDEFARRMKNNRRRRGSSEDISKHLRQRDSRASPIRHSKDDSDTLDLAPSQFPPLPTSPLAPLVKEKQQVPSSPPPEEAITKSPTQSPNKIKVEAAQNTESPPAPTQKVAESKPSPVAQESSPTPLDRMSYAQVTRTAGKSGNSNQIKAPSK